MNSDWRTEEETIAIGAEEERIAREWMATQPAGEFGPLEISITNKVTRGGYLQIRIYVTTPRRLGGERVVRSAWVSQTRDDCRRFTHNAKQSAGREPFGSRHFDD